jgi:hypothetical protein
MWAVHARYFEVIFTSRWSTSIRTWNLPHNATALTDVYAAGYFEVMFTQQVANYDQDLGVTTTGPMQMNWLLRSQAYAWYFLPPITSVLILWW